MIDLYQQIFDDSFETMLKVLKIRAKKTNLTYEILNAELESIYQYEGLDWTGRGETKRAEIEGTILAYQVFIEKFEEKKLNLD